MSICYVAPHLSQAFAGAGYLRFDAADIITGLVACSALGSKRKSAAYYPDPLLANCTKHNIIRNIYEIFRLAHDIDSGIMTTLPFDQDLRSAEVGKYVKKYLSGVEGVPTETRMKILRLIENLTGAARALLKVCTAPVILRASGLCTSASARFRKRSSWQRTWQKSRIKKLS
jgi:hypothetical protein